MKPRRIINRVTSICDVTRHNMTSFLLLAFQRTFPCCAISDVCMFHLGIWANQNKYVLFRSGRQIRTCVPFQLCKAQIWKSILNYSGSSLHGYNTYVYAVSKANELCKVCILTKLIPTVCYNRKNTRTIQNTEQYNEPDTADAVCYQRKVNHGTRWRKCT